VALLDHICFEEGGAGKAPLFLIARAGNGLPPDNIGVIICN